MICLVVNNQYKSSCTKRKLYPKTKKLNKLDGVRELNIFFGQIKIDSQKLTQFILLKCTAIQMEKINELNKALTEWKA